MCRWPRRTQNAHFLQDGFRYLPGLYRRWRRPRLRSFMANIVPGRLVDTADEPHNPLFVTERGAGFAHQLGAAVLGKK